MNTRLKVMWSSLSILSVVALAGGCSRTAQPTGASETAPPSVVAMPVAATGVEASAGIVLCGKCGQVKGTDKCCQEGAAVCPECGLGKGSPGCCKIAKGDDVILCAKCGQIKGSEVCCKSDATVCAKCGLAKGSPGCCKIKL